MSVGVGPPADCTTTCASPSSRARSGPRDVDGLDPLERTCRCWRKSMPWRSSTWSAPTRKRENRQATQFAPRDDPEDAATRSRATSGCADASSVGSSGSPPGAAVHPRHDAVPAERGQQGRVGELSTRRSRGSRAARCRHAAAASPGEPLPPPSRPAASGLGHRPARCASPRAASRSAAPRPRRPGGPGSEPPLSGEAVWISHEAMPCARARGPTGCRRTGAGRTGR